MKPSKSSFSLLALCENKKFGKQRKEEKENIPGI